jgi:hypothetical protein
MKRIVMWMVVLSVALAGSGCLGTKAAKHKVKKAVPGAQTKGEKASKKVSKTTDNSKLNRR